MHKITYKSGPKDVRLLGHSNFGIILLISFKINTIFKNIKIFFKRVFMFKMNIFNRSMCNNNLFIAFVYSIFVPVLGL